MVSGKNGSLSDVDYAALANLRYRIRKFRQFSTKAAEKLGLSPQQNQALLAIKGLGSGEQMSVSTLAARLFVPAASAAELTRSLEGRGYVTIEAEAPDYCAVDRQGGRDIATADACASLRDPGDGSRTHAGVARAPGSSKNGSRRMDAMMATRDLH